MTNARDEAELIAAAQQVVGDAEIVLSAGIFGPQDAMKPVVQGQTVGALLAGPLGVLVGGAVGRESYGKEHDITMQLIVAVTATKVYVITCGDDAPSRVYETFDRATTTVGVKRVGVSRIVTLEDSAAGTHIRLHGAVARYMPQSGPDEDVIAELTKAA